MKNYSKLTALLLTILFTLTQFTAFAASGNPAVSDFRNFNVGALKVIADPATPENDQEWRAGDVWSASSARTHLWLDNTSDSHLDFQSTKEGAPQDPPGGYYSQTIAKRFMQTPFIGTETLTMEMEFFVPAPVNGMIDYAAIGLRGSGVLGADNKYTVNTKDRFFLLRASAENGSTNLQLLGQSTFDGGYSLPRDGEKIELENEKWYTMTTVFTPGSNNSEFYDVSVEIKEGNQTVYSQEVAGFTRTSIATMKKMDSYNFEMGLKNGKNPYGDSVGHNVFSLRKFDISYTRPDVRPVATFLPEAGSAPVDMDQEFEVTFDQAIKDVSASNITITPTGPTPNVEMNGQSDGFTFSFDGLDEFAAYHVDISGIVPADGTEVFNNYEYNFQTKSSIKFGEVSVQRNTYLANEKNGAVMSQAAETNKQWIDANYAAGTHWVYSSNTFFQNMMSNNDGENLIGFKNNDDFLLGNDNGDATLGGYRAGQVGKKVLKEGESLPNNVTFEMTFQIPESIKLATEANNFAAVGLMNSAKVSAAGGTENADNNALFTVLVNEGVPSYHFFGGGGAYHQEMHVLNNIALEPGVWYTAKMEIDRIDENPTTSPMVKLSITNADGDQILTEEQQKQKTWGYYSTNARVLGFDTIRMAAGTKNKTTVGDFGLLTIKDIKMYDTNAIGTAETLQVGENQISVDYSHAQNQPFDAVMVRALCSGTAENYQIEDINLIEKEDGLSHGTLSDTVTITDANQFVKVFLFNDMYHITPLAPSTNLFTESN